MPRTSRPPAYRLHRARNLAVVTIAGKDHYLGPFGSPESHEKYARLIAEWHANGGRPIMPDAAHPSTSSPSVNSLILDYWQFAQGYYVKNGQPSGECDNIRLALRPLRQLFGNSRADEFGPKSLLLVRQAMIDAGLAQGDQQPHRSHQAPFPVGREAGVDSPRRLPRPARRRGTAARAVGGAGDGAGDDRP